MVWEATLPVYAIWKGFRAISTAALDERAPSAEPGMATV